MLKTKIFWTIHNFCKSKCYYCPSNNWNGEEPFDIQLYLNFAEKAIKHYESLNRIIDWNINGGEPLDLFDLPMLLKLCKREDNCIEITTNGGKLWIDWWALEPYIDRLNLSFHYWQHPNLIDYIVDMFLKKQKFINVIVPIRSKYFEEDIKKCQELEQRFNIQPNKLIISGEDYSDEQSIFLMGKDVFEESKTHVIKFWSTHKEDFLQNNPIYTGKPCNEGIEILKISEKGFVSGSNCGNSSYGNIWNNDFKFPVGPQPCRKMACIDSEDQTITKFLD